MIKATFEKSQTGSDCLCNPCFVKQDNECLDKISFIIFMFILSLWSGK